MKRMDKKFLWMIPVGFFAGGAAGLLMGIFRDQTNVNSFYPSAMLLVPFGCFWGLILGIVLFLLVIWFGKVKKYSVILLIMCSIFFGQGFCQTAGISDTKNFQEMGLLTSKVSLAKMHKDIKGAIENQKILIQFTDKTFGKESRESGMATVELADLCFTDNNYEAAKNFYLSGLATLKKKPEPKSLPCKAPRFAKALMNMADCDIAADMLKLGMVYRRANDFASAQSIFKESEAILKKEISSSDYSRQSTAIPILGRVYDELGGVSLDKKDAKAAKEFYRQALATVKTYLGDDSPTVKTYKEHLAQAGNN